MIEGLRVVFTKEEKTDENLIKFNKITASTTHTGKEAFGWFQEDKYVAILWKEEHDNYIFSTADRLDGTEISWTDFLAKYDSVSEVTDTDEVNQIKREMGKEDGFTVIEDESDSFRTKVYEITNGLAELLISKNAKYGNSALEPKRIFSSADATEQIKVRIDDKLSRMANQDEDEDVVQDLMGYLVLLTIAKSDRL